MPTQEELLEAIAAERAETAARPRRGRPRKNAAAKGPQQSVTMTYEELQALLANTVREAIVAAKAPTPEEAEKRAKEKADFERRRLEMIEMAKAEEQAKLDSWANCTHTKPDGKPSVGGQLHSDGLVHPICLRCQFPFPPFKPSEHHEVGGRIQ